MKLLPKRSRLPSRPNRFGGYEIPMLDLNGRERAEFGVIATVRDEDTGRLLSLHEEGPPTKAVGVIAGKVDDLGASWRIVSISSPASIYRDLQGTRYYTLSHDPRHSGLRQSAHDPRTSEVALLSRIGRVDLLARLPPGSMQEARSRP